MTPESVDAPLLRLGTCSWTAKGWAGTVYPKGTKPAEYLRHYAARWNTVEIDATFYAAPAAATVDRWRDETPDGFVFAAKMPQVVTHEKFLADCGADLAHFIDTMARLRGKLGPLLLQFPYFAQRGGVTLSAFLERLAPVLRFLPTRDLRFAVEVRNKTWIADPLLDLLHDRGVALALIDHPWMAPPEQLFRHPGIITGPFAYLRWLGDLKAIEAVTKTFDKPVVDRTVDIARWAPQVQRLLERNVPVFGYVNNHYSGHAPADVALLQERLKP